MHSMRRLLRNRLTANPISGLIAALLVLQGLWFGQAQGLMVAAAALPDLAICTIGHDSAGGPAGNPAPDRQKFDCPCGALCRLAGTMLPAITGGGGAVVVAALPPLPMPVRRHMAQVRPRRCRWTGRPRAPPAED